jgi:anti-sigma factor RsiW
MNDAHAGHLDDGDLIRYLDGEGSTAEAEAWERHLDGCEPCALRVATADRESRGFTEWLDRAAFEDDLPDRARTEVTVPAVLSLDRRMNRPRAGWSPWLKAAAALALVAGPLAAIPPLRGWVADRIGAPVEAPGPGVPTAAAEAASPVVRFVPRAGVFTVRIEGDGGSLVLGRAPGEEAELRLAGTAPDAVVAAASVRLRDLEAGTRSTLLLPAHVTAVRVRSGGREMVVDGPAIEAGEVVPPQ